MVCLLAMLALQLETRLVLTSDTAALRLRKSGGELRLAQPPEDCHNWAMLLYALTIFVGAFLLFQVQPLIGKYILPWFGGVPGVWTTCMLFFQVALLGGYAYAHWLTRLRKPRVQAVIHLVLLVAALALLPIQPTEGWKPQGGGNPTAQILILLVVTLGLPYFVLSATGPLLQQWFSRSYPGVSPYRLYAVSNAGSLLALLSYPFFFETHFTRRTQSTLWGWGLVAYALGCGFCALKLRRTGDRRQETGDGGQEMGDGRDALALGPRPSALLLWVLLPASASILLLATTNKLCQDVAVIPFLWVLPLALYLLSFIICFDNPRWYQRLPFTLALIAAIAADCWALFNATDASLYQQVMLYCGALFVCCMACHGELYRLRPEPKYLTSFYLMIAAGGALGGVFVAVVAPLVFTDYYELHWGLLLCAACFTLACVGDRGSTPRLWRWLACALTLAAWAGVDLSVNWLAGHYRFLPKQAMLGLRIALWSLLGLVAASWAARGQFKTFRYWRFLACLWMVAGVWALGAMLWREAHRVGSDRIYASRNFYGVLKVYDYRKDQPKDRHILLQHGRITHGLQFVDPEEALWPTTYYGPDSGIGLAMRAVTNSSRRIGVIGLGTGSIAAWCRPGDYLRIYEINPQVQQVASSLFSYVRRSPARSEIVLGDARLSMEREPPQNYDLLVLDAFSSDAIPVHLLTRESFALYERHLKTNGVMVVHISNHYLDLEPVLISAAREFDLEMASISYDDPDDDWWLYPSTWVLLSHNHEVIRAPAICAATETVKTNSSFRLWTDDFVSVFQILK